MPLIDNEVIIDRESWTHMQPNSVEAIWYLSFADCDRQDTSMQCLSTARTVREQFAAAYRIDPASVPMVKLDPWNWDDPFSPGEI